MSTSDTRRILRYVHLAASIAIGTYVYSPWSAITWFDTAIKVAVIPGLAISGLWMWQQGRIRRWLAR